MKRAVWTLALCLGVALFLGNGLAAEKVVLQKYPDLKLGFTTVNFMKQMPVTLANAKKWVDIATELGFVWIELRDPMATLTLAECQELAAYAKQRGIGVAYGMNIGLLDANFWEVFARGLGNAAVFEGPRTVRTAGPGLEFAADAKKTHWTFGELQRVVETANQAANLAKMFGLQYVAENGTEALKGDGVRTFGTVELFANVNGNVGFQLDTGNFFCTARVWTNPEDAKAFLEKTAGRMGYMHLKTSTPDHKPAQVLADNELDFDAIFAAATNAKRPWVAFELVQPDTFDQVLDNHKKSVAYLKGKFGG